MVRKLVKARKEKENEPKKSYKSKKNPARIQLGIEISQLGLARLGTFIARLGSAREISA